MTRIVKRSGKSEDFDIEKLERSIILAGASRDAAKDISRRIEVKEGISSQELRRMTARELEKERADLAQNYLSTRNLRAVRTSNVAEGMARVNRQLLEKIGASKDEPAQLTAGKNQLKMRLEEMTSGADRDVQLSDSDMRRLGIEDGSRVSVRFEMR
ncbi:MAG TPA: hypothetical protein ENN25_01195 [Euryarchaeota archaeon]|nr:hypothetical protein [Euryarchaeota archaeon]